MPVSNRVSPEGYLPYVLFGTHIQRVAVFNPRVASLCACVLV